MVAFHYYLSMLRAQVGMTCLAQSVVRLLAMMIGPGSNLFHSHLFCLFAFTRGTCGKYFEMDETSWKSWICSHIPSPFEILPENPSFPRMFWRCSEQRGMRESAAKLYQLRQYVHQEDCKVWWDFGSNSSRFRVLAQPDPSSVSTKIQNEWEPIFFGNS